MLDMGNRFGINIFIKVSSSLLYYQRIFVKIRLLLLSWGLAEDISKWKMQNKLDLHTYTWQEWL